MTAAQEGEVEFHAVEGQLGQPPQRRSVREAGRGRGPPIAFRRCSMSTQSAEGRRRRAPRALRAGGAARGVRSLERGLHLVGQGLLHELRRSEVDREPQRACRRCHSRTWTAAVRRIQGPMARMRPVKSDLARKLCGKTSPSCGCCQRRAPPPDQATRHEGEDRLVVQDAAGVGYRRRHAPSGEGGAEARLELELVEALVEGGRAARLEAVAALPERGARRTLGRGEEGGASSRLREDRDSHARGDGELRRRAGRACAARAGPSPRCGSRPRRGAVPAGRGRRHPPPSRAAVSPWRTQWARRRPTPRSTRSAATRPTRSFSTVNPSRSTCTTPTRARAGRPARSRRTAGRGRGARS